MCIRDSSRGTRVVVDPPGTWTCEDGEINDRSLVLTAAGVLFTGDLEQHGEACLVDRLPPSTVLKLAHHGSRTSSSEPFLDAIRPSLALISAGRGNRFGHPHEVVLHRLQARGIPVLRTDELGTIELRRLRGVLQWRHYWGRWSPWYPVERPGVTPPGLVWCQACGGGAMQRAPGPRAQSPWTPTWRMTASGQAIPRPQSPG